MTRAALTAGCALAVLLASAVPAIADQPAPTTPAGWRVQPAGTEFGVAKDAPGFQGPMGAALSPDGTHLLAASSGANKIESADLFDLGAQQRSDYLPYDATKAPGQAAFYGVAFAPDGKHAWVSGSGQNVVHALTVDGGSLKETGQISTPFFPAGLAYGHTSRGDRLYVANNLSTNAGGAGGNPPGHQLTVVDPQTNAVTGTIDLARRSSRSASHSTARATRPM
jgi:DNA-binding beta-propeller fold protein YncE